MKILIIGNKKSEQTIYIYKEAINRGHTADIISKKSISIKYDGPSIFVSSDDIHNEFLSYDVYIFRIIKNDFASTIASYLKLHGKVFIDKDMDVPGIGMKNITTVLKNPKFSIPSFVLSPQKSDIENFKYPAVLKDTYGKKGKNAYIVEDSNQAIKILKDNKDITFMMQEYIKKDKEIRIIFVGDKILNIGMLKINDKKFVQNIAQGGIGIPVKLSKEELEIAEQCMMISSFDIGGIDIMLGSKDSIEPKQEYFVLEINRSPIFLEFMKVTNMNVPNEIIKLLEERYTENKN
ncbi:MAG: ATP-grasp domain-containing protein [Patescibacteria group bacterium]